MGFDDFLWIDLHDARLREGVLYAEISLRATDGRTVAIVGLPKTQARKIYRIAQEREEAAREARRARWMEEQRAGATNVVVNAALAPPPAQTPHPAMPTIAEDPVAKLQKLKLMLDQGLIQQSEYDAAKAKILGAL